MGTAGSNYCLLMCGIEYLHMDVTISTVSVRVADIVSVYLRLVKEKVILISTLLLDMPYVNDRKKIQLNM